MGAITSETVQGVLYAFTTMLSIAIFGTAGEFCSVLDDAFRNPCSGRIGAVLAMGVLATVLAIPMLVAYVFDISIIKRFELIVAPIIVLCNATSTGIMSSPRTGITINGSNVVAVLIFTALASWWSTFASVGALFVALGTAGGLKLRVTPAGRDSDTKESTRLVSHVENQNGTRAVPLTTPVTSGVPGHAAVPIWISQPAPASRTTNASPPAAVSRAAPPSQAASVSQPAPVSQERAYGVSGQETVPAPQGFYSIQQGTQAPQVLPPAGAFPAERGVPVDQAVPIQRAAPAGTGSSPPDS